MGINEHAELSRFRLSPDFCFWAAENPPMAAYVTMFPASPTDNQVLRHHFANYLSDRDALPSYTAGCADHRCTN
jgi:hypothetical protein